MKKHWTTVLLIVIFTLGLCLLLYPAVSDWFNSFHQSKAISTYTEKVENMGDAEYEEFLLSAEEFNSLIRQKGGLKYLTDEELKKYNDTLDITGTGVMAYIDIPAINVSLPVYHGVSDIVLQVAVGHIEWSSLPVGGKSTHCVLSGHRGLPSAKLFTNLDKLSEGDVFMLHILNETITYQVDQILIVSPENTDSLGIVDGEDFCSLVTCTPYGVNSHRLIVRGHRIDNLPDTPTINVGAEATRIDPLLIAPVVAAPLLLSFLIYVLIKYRKRKG